MSLALLALVAALSAGQDQNVQTPSGSTVLPPIDVTGRIAGADLETRIDDFVGQVAAPIGDDWGPARWNRRRPLCIGAASFQPEAARQLIDRVAAVAAEVDLRIADPGCDPVHIMIVATNDGPGMARALVQTSRPLFVGGGDGMDLGRRALERFQTGERPVRWWQVSQPVDETTGMRTTRRVGDNMLRGENPENQNEDPENVILRPYATRLSNQSRDDLRNVMIIVDVPRLGEVSFSQLADFVAMLALAQIDPDLEVADHDTILAVFDRPQDIPGLTDWDRAYLRGLYDARLDGVSQNSRLGALERAAEDPR